MKTWNITKEQFEQLKKGYKVFDNDYVVDTSTLLQSEETGKKMGVVSFRKLFEHSWTSRVIDNFEVKGNVIDLVVRKDSSNNIYLWEVVEINIFDNFKEVPLQLESKVDANER